MKTLFKTLLQLGFNLITGAFALVVFNLVAGLINYHLPLNFFTALATGALGIPGIALLAALKALYG
ncbi:MAG: pro-sigmaK processing inhibitor BofA family protein [Clostridiales bacterium]|nr:pro-sigmaK processing inhibitor BofA family protein [Clostridiales bacterium]